MATTNANNTNLNSENKVYFKDGQTYQQFRPNYPQRFIDKIRSVPVKHNNYLDIATGTGQVLFPVYDIFKSLIVAQDLSEGMLKVTKEKAEKLRESGEAKQDFKYLLGDAHAIEEQLAKSDISSKFDLITVGEAFHWFRMEDLLGVFKEKLLAEDGTLVLVEYAPPIIGLNSSDEELKEEMSKAYQEFWEKVVVFIKFNLHALQTGFDGVPFEKYYAKVERDRQTEITPSKKEDMIGHLKTWSFYNSLVEKCSGEAGYKDPLVTIGEKMDAVFEKAKKNGSLLDEEKPFVFIVHYFLVACYKKE